jgi:uncharacterized damage-inducible protein DinB
MSTVTFVVGLMKTAHGLFNATIGEISEEQFYWQPAGKALPITAHFAHVVVTEDVFVNAVLKEGNPLAHSAFEGKHGLSETPPVPDKNGFPDYSEWASRVKMDLAQFREYAKAVFAATEEYISGLDDDGLYREFNSPFSNNQTTPARMISTLIIHTSTHCGEISCVKGLQELKGYPI